MSDTVQLQEFDCTDLHCITASSGELGCGKTSTVRLTFHERLNWVAVKCFVVTGGDRDKEKIVKKIQKEFVLLQKAMHNYIVRVHGWVKWPESIGLVVEYMPGGNLVQFLEDDSKKPYMLVFLRIFYELASGLAFIHNLPSSQRIVHGDLKPENVLLTSELHCKLSDFGSAQIVALTGFTTSHGASQNKLDMTLAYAPPEKLKSLNIKPKKEHDTYSFGMMLYAILSGSPPYQHSYHESAFRESIIRGERPDEESIDELRANLTEHQQQILDALRSIMRRCWAQDPLVRPTMLEVRDELKSLLEQQSEEAIAGEVSEMLEVVEVSIPNKEENQFQPLHEFSPKTGRFEKATTYNIYEIANARQTAFGCEKVNFNEKEADGSNEEGKTETQLSSDGFQQIPRHTSVVSKSSPAKYHPSEGPADGNSQQSPLSTTVSENTKQLKFPLQEIFFPSGSSSLTTEVSVAQDLFKNYTLSLKSKKYQEATEIKTELTQLIKNHVNTTAEDIRSFGVKLREDKLFLESILIFDAASTLSKKIKNPEKKLEMMKFVVDEIKETNREIIKYDAGMKLLVKDYVIPLMCDKLHYMESMSSVSEQYKCLQVSWVLRHIEWSQYLVDQLKEAEQTVREGLKRIDEVFGENKIKYRVYGVLLNNLGVACRMTSRYEEAISVYKESIVAFKAATDYAEEEERKRHIELSEMGLKQARQKNKCFLM